jgi:hypothetical protein
MSFNICRGTLGSLYGDVGSTRLAEELIIRSGRLPLYSNRAGNSRRGDAAR